MIFAQILHSLFFAILNYVLYLEYNNGSIKRIYIYLLIIVFFALLVYNHFYKGVSNQLFLFALMFSVSLVILQFMRKFLTVFEKNKALEKRKQSKEKILLIQNIILNRILIIGLLFYQLLLIWIPAIYEKMNES